MKKLILLLATFLVANLTFAQHDSTSCANYHKGFFSYTDTLGNIVIVHRKNKYQYEKNIVTKVKTQFRITWTGECNYEIQQTLTNSKAARKNKYSTTKVTISQPDGDNGYAWSCACTDTEKGKGYMKKITKKAYYNLF